MAWNPILLFTFLIILSSCKGQDKATTVHPSNTFKTSPAVIRNFMASAAPPNFDTTLVGQYIRSIFQDSKGNLWFGTIGEGVVRYDGKTLTYFSNGDGFNCTSVFAINEDKHGNLWLGTDQGVYKYDPSTPLTSTPLSTSSTSGKTFRLYNQKDGLNHIDISRKSILVDKSGNIWVGTHGGVYRYDPSEDAKGGPGFSLFQQLPPVNISGIMEDHSGNIWFATTQNGVFRYNPSASAGEKAIINIKDKAGLGDNYAGGIAEDKDGNMWILMKNGICKYTSTGKALTEYTPKDGLGGTEFWGIYIEESGIIWVTARGCTTRFDPSIPLPNPKAFTVFTVEDGINCCVQSMYQDKSGNMWWGAGQGLYRFDGEHFYQVKQKGPWF